MATIKYYLDIRRPRQDGTCPLRIEFCSLGKSAYQPTPYSLRRDQWRRGRVVNHERAAAINMRLQRMMLQLVEALEQSCGYAPKLPASVIRERVLRAMGGGGNISVSETISKFAGLKDRKSTVDSFNYTSKMVETFAPDITFEDLTIDWLTAFDRWLGKRGLKRNTCAIHLENLRAVVNYAIDEGMTANYPFKRFKIRRELSPKRALSLDEMRLLWHYQPTTPSQAWYLDVFRLSFCLCGLNIVDLANLTPSNVQGLRIVLQRQKTGSLLSILIEPEAAELLKRLRGNGYLVNIRNRYKSHRDFIRRCNEGLKRLGTITKREGRGGRIVERERLFPTLSTYYARHSWASIAAELGASVETISLGLGHRYGSAVTQTYITPSLRLLDECNRKVLDAVVNTNSLTNSLT